MSKYFSVEETQCHCGCGGNIVSDKLMEGLDRLREGIGGPLYLSCAYRCPEHNRAVGGVSNSQHIDGTAADVLCPDYLTFGEFKWYVEEYSGADGIGIYEDDGFVHIDYRDNGTSQGKYRWEG